jgi:hypothetical protein
MLLPYQAKITVNLRHFSALVGKNPLIIVDFGGKSVYTAAVFTDCSENGG